MSAAVALCAEHDAAGGERYADVPTIETQSARHVLDAVHDQIRLGRDGRSTPVNAGAGSDDRFRRSRKVSMRAATCTGSTPGCAPGSPAASRWLGPSPSSPASPSAMRQAAPAGRRDLRQQRQRCGVGRRVCEFCPGAMVCRRRARVWPQARERAQSRHRFQHSARRAGGDRDRNTYQSSIETGSRSHSAAATMLTGLWRCRVP